MDLKAIESKFWELKGKYLSGVIDEAEFKNEMKNLKVRDSEGSWWKLNEENGKWRFFDGDEWVEGNPVFSERAENENHVESESSDTTTVKYHFVDPIDEDYDFGIEANHLHGSMKELENVRMPELFEMGLAYGQPRDYVNIDKVTQKEYVKSKLADGKQDMTIIPISEDPVQIDTQKSVSQALSEIKISVSGTKPKIPKSFAAAQTVVPKVVKEAVKIGSEAIKTGKEPSQTKAECPKCNAPVKDNTKFCTSCGYKFEKIKKDKGLCLNCGHKNNDSTKFCVECGKLL